MKKRILHVINNLNHGGAEHQLLLNLSAMDRERFECHVCTLGEGGELEPAFAALGVPVYKLRAAGVKRWPVAVLRLRKLIRRLSVDLVHTSVSDADIVGGIASRLAGVPGVSTLVNTPYGREWLIDNPHLNRAKLKAIKTCLSLSYRMCHSRHIAISRFVADSATRELKLRRDRVRIIYRGLPPDWFKPVPLSSNPLAAYLNGGRAYPVLLNVGRLMPQKGQRYLLEAMPKVLERFPDARLFMVGRGFLQEMLEAESARLSLGDSVVFLGVRNDVRALLAASDIFVFSSLFEGLGVALIEAAGAGKPCIASNVGPLPEVIEQGKTGLLVEPRSPSALAEAVIEIAGDRERMLSMGCEARRLAEQRFHVGRVVEQMGALYDEVLSR